jgi:hypothetical protein
MGTGGPFPGAKARPGHDADHSPHLVPWSRMSRSYFFMPLSLLPARYTTSSCLYHFSQPATRLLHAFITSPSALRDFFMPLLLLPARYTTSSCLYYFSQRATRRPHAFITSPSALHDFCMPLSLLSACYTTSLRP